ncbi:protein-glutamine gamma-glutamyltransferase K-like [Mya arenaria]|uniref:protein-glutamine gamma-glutamyltransferase K-like n=1 Tax=Mya arenaria TaxID=6604 RepID=UPI0022E6943E|nr:protein-glutamine gamma-glutamyltransferase K-like [Mya arenaria]
MSKAIADSVSYRMLFLSPHRNFHVLNTAWMRRRDLPFGNDGWQVVDATPQERSQDLYSCGPAPLSAIQSGRCDVNYDAPFVFATVNADRVHWGRQRDGTWIVISVETNVTGRKVVTKAADGRPVPASFTYCDSYMEDVTNQFKHPEESKRERMSVLLASSLAPGSRKGDVYAHNKDIEFTVKTPDNVLVGSDVTISVTCRNKVGEVRSLTGTVFVDVITYTGKPRTTCVTEEINLKLEPHDRQTYTVHVSAEKYAAHVGEAAMLRVSMLARANESGQVHVIQELYRFRTPDLTIKCYNSTCYAGRPLSLRASFTNPFKDWPLTQCYLFVENTGAGEPKLMSLRSVPANREMSCDVELTFNQRGRHSIYATFYSRELQGIKGVLDIYVQ